MTDASTDAASHTAVGLVDVAGAVPRRTATLLEALMSRAAAVSVISGAQTLASMVAGLAALGRQVGGTVEGARVRRALAGGRPGRNLELLFSETGFGDLLAVVQPTPVLEDFHNDLALLLAPDLDQAIRTGGGVGGGAAIGPGVRPEPVDPVDFLVGFWSFSREMTSTIDALVEVLAPAGPTVAAGPGPDEPTPGRLLR